MCYSTVAPAPTFSIFPKKSQAYWIRTNDFANLEQCLTNPGGYRNDLKDGNLHWPSKRKSNAPGCFFLF